MDEKTQPYREQRIEVPAEFSDIVTYFYAAANESSTDVRKILVPSFQTMLAFSFGRPATMESASHSLEVGQCIVLGPVKQPIHYTLPSGADILVVNFKDDAFYRFFGPALMDGPIAAHPDNLVNEGCFAQLWFELKNLLPEERTTRILDFCRPYLKCRDAAFDGIRSQADDYLHVNPIKAVALQTRRSERSIQLHHKKFLGYSAKERSRYERFLKAMEMSQQDSGKVDWLAIADRCGYYDQSQLIHDFKHFLGVSPGRYLQLQHEICSVGP